jgi:hypothetical protein
MILKHLLLYKHHLTEDNLLILKICDDFDRNLKFHKTGILFCLWDFLLQKWLQSHFYHPLTLILYNLLRTPILLSSQHEFVFQSQRKKPKKRLKWLLFLKVSQLVSMKVIPVIWILSYGFITFFRYVFSLLLLVALPSKIFNYK